MVATCWNIENQNISRINQHDLKPPTSEPDLKFAEFLQSWPVHRWDFQIRWPSIKEKSIECLTRRQKEVSSTKSTPADNKFHRTPLFGKNKIQHPVHVPIDGEPVFLVFVVRLNKDLFGKPFWKFTGSFRFWIPPYTSKWEPSFIDSNTHPKGQPGSSTHLGRV